MNEKLEILQCLIENRAFAPSHSSLAKILGYKGKMVIYRLMKGQTKSSTVDEIWNRIINNFCLSDTVLCNLARIFEGAKYYCDLFLPEMNMNCPEWIENLVMSLTEGCYDCFSPKIKEEEAPFLKDLKIDEPDIFWGIVIIIYIRYKKIDVYAEKPQQIFCKLIDAFDKILYTLYPERVDAHETSSNLEKLETNPNLWKIIMNCIIQFKRYTEVDYAKNASQCGRLFNFGKRSYWHTPDNCYKQGSEVWLLVEQSFDRATNGYYIALHIEAGKDIDTFNLKDAFVFTFWTVDEEEDPCILQACCGADTQRKWCFYCYEHDEDKETLTLHPNPESGNLFGLPNVLQMINIDHPTTKDDKIWSRILTKWDAGQGNSVFQQAKEWISGRVDLKDKYPIADVQINKNLFTIFIKQQNRIAKYELPINTYDFFSQLNPSMQIVIVKHLTDNEIYVEWPSLGYAIKLSEFTHVD